MKRLTMMLMALITTIAMNAQYYNVGTSTSTTDIFGTRSTQQRSNSSNTSIWTW